MSEEEIKQTIEIINGIIKRFDEQNIFGKTVSIEIEALRKLLDLYNKEKNDINKLIRYIAIRENKDFEQVMKEFEIGG